MSIILSSMIQAFIATSTVALILILSELLWRKAHIRGEFARKFVHIIAGIFIAFLPFWVSYGWISILGLGFVTGNILNRYTPLFHAIHAITRKSWGDLLFGVAVVATSLIRPNKWLFAGAILQVALADGLAAVVGTHYGKKPYKIFDHKKSVIGTLTFYFASLLVLVCMVTAAGFYPSHGWILLYGLLPITMTIVENGSGYGSDNLTLPILFIALVRIMTI